MRCSKCDRDNRAGRRFCAHCGAKLTLVCGSCEAENEPGEQFCGECGKELAEPAEPRPPPDPLSYTPKHLAEKILSTRSALEGEWKQVTVLFARINGSTERMEDLAEPASPTLAFGACRDAGHVSEHSSPGDSAGCRLRSAPLALLLTDGDA